jgi:hypothetical protein
VHESAIDVRARFARLENKRDGALAIRRWFEVLLAGHRKGAIDRGASQQ